MNLTKYLQRIQSKDDVKPDRATLYALHRQHATHIPFENLDIQLGLPISLNPEILESKLVEKRRGGYCFEQNTLFQAILKQIGFDVYACEARVHMGRKDIGPRTHMLLVVSLEGESYLTDVGFGGDGLLEPVPLNGQAHSQFLWTYRVVNEGEEFVLQALRKNFWLDLYSFLPQPRYSIDFEVANWYTSTHPESRFVQTLTVQLPTPEARYILRGNLLTKNRGDQEESRELQTHEDLLEVLDNTFGLSFPAGTRFRNGL